MSDRGEDIRIYERARARLGGCSASKGMAEISSQNDSFEVSSWDSGVKLMHIKKQNLRWACTLNGRGESDVRGANPVK